MDEHHTAQKPIRDGTGNQGLLSGAAFCRKTQGWRDISCSSNTLKKHKDKTLIV